ncbi:unnamed protein product [Rotaria sordida]|uniref:Uncharacterized protein n=2 Tax=Rotaria sordida TaxID=392033 RepID=A0A813QAK2_9BILA|nr:unnamed protein product [Rotaria sordida]
MVNPPISKSNEQRNDDLIFSYLTKIEDFIITDKQRSETFANYVKHFADLKCSLLPSSFNTVTPLSIHIHGFEPEQIYQQLKSINETRFKSFLATIVKNKTKQKTFGNLLRSPSPEKPSLIEENIKQEEEENNNEDLSISTKKNSKKKKKSVTFFDSNALNKFLNEQDFQEVSRSNRKINEDDDDLEDDDDDDDDDDLSLDEENFIGDESYGKSNYSSQNWSNISEKRAILSALEYCAFERDVLLTNQAQSGDHSHSYYDPKHYHGGQTGTSAYSGGIMPMYKPTGGRGSDHGLHSHSISIDKTRISINTAGSHSHSIIGQSGAVGGGHAFSILNPYQTVNYIIYSD